MIHMAFDRLMKLQLSYWPGPGVFVLRGGIIYSTTLFVEEVDVDALPVHNQFLLLFLPEPD